MVKEILAQLYERDLRKVVGEIEQYKSDEDLWVVPDGISNSGGNLALHLIGNIKHFFGANLGATGYRRERDLEFSDRNLTRDELTGKLESTIGDLKNTFDVLTAETLDKDYPEPLGGETQKTVTVLIYMLTHLNYHLGQINYHRRFISAKK